MTSTSGQGGETARPTDRTSDRPNVRPTDAAYADAGATGARNNGGHRPMSDCEGRPLLEGGRSLTSPSADGSSSCSSSRQKFRFLLYVCLSTSLRSFEAGVVSSMMPSIQRTLQLDFTAEGTIAASPDYGIAPGSLLAIFVFTHLPAYPVLVVATAGTGLATLGCAVRPSLQSLVMARAVGGLLWAHAATHYPVWIDKYGPTSRKGGGGGGGGDNKAMWLASYQVSLLGGVLMGYVVGGAARTATGGTSSDREEGGITWVHLYYVEAFLMLGCAAALVMGFYHDLVRIDFNGGRERGGQGAVLYDEQGVNRGGENGEGSKNVSPRRPTSVLELLRSLLRSRPFFLSVLLNSLQAGTTVFALYFITQVCEVRGFTDWETVVGVSAVFVTSPGPGTLFGSYIVGQLGGYEDHVVTFGLALSSGAAVLGSSLLFPLSRFLWGTGTTNAKAKAPFIVACWLFFFTGGMSTAPLNGVAVSAVPRASHVASGLQFALANTGKIVIPQIGGAVVDWVGLAVGFDGMIVACTAVFFGLAAVGFVHAKRREGIGF